MRYLPKEVKLAAVAAPLLLVAGCASQSEIDSLRAEVQKAQEMAKAAEDRAAAAEAEAQRAANEAATASEKADRIFRMSLKK
jgi:outer membrane murein-binding lipoprotein Lpp